MISYLTLEVAVAVNARIGIVGNLYFKTFSLK